MLSKLWGFIGNDTRCGNLSARFGELTVLNIVRDFGFPTFIQSSRSIRSREGISSGFQYLNFQRENAHVHTRSVHRSSNIRMSKDQNNK